MKQLLLTVLLATLTLAVTLEDAEARRLGGSRSFGVQRNVAPRTNVQPVPPSQPAAAAPAAAPNAAAPQPAGSRWLGPIAGLAAGLGLGWLVSQGGAGGMLGVLLIMALVVFFVLRLFARAAPAANVRYAGVEPGLGEPLDSPGAAPGYAAPAATSIPAGFDTEGFLRQAKLNFVKLQAAHDSGKLDELREFTSDEMYASIERDLQQQGAARQQTDVVTLNADLLEARTEGDTHWASVHFSGTIRETPEAQPEPFQEIWNLAKPTSGTTGWVLAGIQQIQ